MNNEAFEKLITEHAAQTANIRIGTPWNGGTEGVPDEIAGEIGGVVALLQANIDEFICSKSEYILIYNFQRVSDMNNPDYFTLDMMVKPLTDSNLSARVGRPLQLVINGVSKEVMNNTRGMIEMGLSDDEEDQEEEPMLYGNYAAYLGPKPNFKDKLIALQSMFAASPLTQAELKVKADSETAPMPITSPNLYLSFGAGGVRESGRRDSVDSDIFYGIPSPNSSVEIEFSQRGLVAERGPLVAAFV